MNYLYMRADGSFMLTNNVYSLYRGKRLFADISYSLSPTNAWSASLETSSDRHTLIATFSTFDELLASHPELFI